MTKRKVSSARGTAQEKPKRRGRALEDGKGGIPHGPTANPRWRGRN